MSLQELLFEKRTTILKRWFDLIAASHPAGVPHYTKDKDQFTNPEGHTVSREIDSLYNELLQDRISSEKVCASLDGILRIRAVQDFSPGVAVGFVFLLKEAITEELGNKIEEEQLFKQWLELELKIDKMASLAFDIYTQCREKICQLRINEIKADRAMAFRLLEIAENAGRKKVGAGE
jgi:hypothetical protein